MSKLQAYQYEPLAEKTVCLILPGAFEDDICVKLFTTPFSNDHKTLYQALSYVWGPISDPADILVSTGNWPPRVLYVTRNLFVALQYLRDPEQSRSFWIDAICIHQTNLKERSEQVQLVAGIYSRAERVVVWLGEEADSSTVALRMIQIVGENVTADYKTFFITARSKVQVDGGVDWRDRRQERKLSSDMLTAVTCLLQRAWFRRHWVWQEILLAPETSIISCGTFSVPWKSFRTVIFLLHFKRNPAFRDPVLKRLIRHISDL